MAEKAENDILTVGGRDAGYLFEFKPLEGVFLTVYPSSEGEVMFELSDMRQILQDYSVLDYDMALLSRVVREASGNAYRISDKFVEPTTKKSYRRQSEDGEE